MHPEIYRRLTQYRDSEATPYFINDILRAVLDIWDEVNRILNRLEDLED